MVTPQTAGAPSRPGGHGKRRPAMRRVGMGVIAALALIAGSSAVTASADNIAVNLSCDDGTNVNLTVDLTTLQELEDSVQAMILYPAGISCGVTQLPTAGFLNLAKPVYADSAHDFAVGANQVTGPPDACTGDITINVSAHKDTGAADNTATGHITLNAVPGAGTCSGHERVDVNCLNVDGTAADISGLVTEATGYFATTPAGLLAGKGGVQNLSILDNPSPLQDAVGTAQMAGDCTRVGYNRIVESGNFVVRSGA